jgi:hypothetical protein
MRSPAFATVLLLLALLAPPGIAAVKEAKASASVLELLERQQGVREELCGSWVYRVDMLGMKYGTHTLTVEAAKRRGEACYHLTAVTVDTMGNTESSVDLCVAPDLRVLEGSIEEATLGRNRGRSECSLDGSTYTFTDSGERHGLGDGKTRTSTGEHCPGRLLYGHLYPLVAMLLDPKAKRPYDFLVWGFEEQGLIQVRVQVRARRGQKGQYEVHVAEELGERSYVLDQAHVIQTARRTNKLFGDIEQRWTLLEGGREPEPEGDEKLLADFQQVEDLEHVDTPTAAELLAEVQAQHATGQGHAGELATSVPMLGEPVLGLTEFRCSGRRFWTHAVLDCGMMSQDSEVCFDGTTFDVVGTVTMMGDELEPQRESRQIPGDELAPCLHVPVLYYLLGGTLGQAYDLEKASSVRTCTRGGLACYEVDLQTRVQDLGCERVTLVVDRATKALVGHLFLCEDGSIATVIKELHEAELDDSDFKLEK